MRRAGLALLLVLWSGCGAAGSVPARGQAEPALPGEGFEPSEAEPASELARPSPGPGHELEGRSGDRPTIELLLGSADPTYGYSREHPVRVGGGPIEGDLNARRYLNSLWGPEGQPLRWQRVGTSERAAGERPAGPTARLAIFSLAYDGLDEPVHLFVDRSRTGELRVPAGLTSTAAGSPQLPE